MIRTKNNEGKFDFVRMGEKKLLQMINDGEYKADFSVDIPDFIHNNKDDLYRAIAQKPLDESPVLVETDILARGHVDLIKEGCDQGCS